MIKTSDELFEKMSKGVVYGTIELSGVQIIGYIRKLEQIAKKTPCFSVYCKDRFAVIFYYEVGKIV